MSKDLTSYNFPDDLKNMSIDELELLTYKIREFLIANVSKTGGHIASNLGVVELSLALHKAFDSPKDKLIWDVGHQSYVHKILTGRANQFSTLRQMSGMSGFPKAKESEHDVFDTGHSSTSLSAAAGYAAARDIKGEDYNVVAVIGDGSMTGGMAFEALNNIGSAKTHLIVVLNDNGMSISKNIGGLSQHLTRLRTSEEYQRTKKNIKDKIRNIPRVGEELSTSLGKAKDKIKYALISEGVIFEELGFTYVGPIDGHNIKEILDAFEIAKHAEGPVLIHAITKKGKGYLTAEKHPNKFHGIGPFNPETGEVLGKSAVSYSKVFGDTVYKMAESDKKIVTVCAAMSEATGLGLFSEKYPRRFFDVGIAEAHAVTFAAGLAKGGLKPYVAIYSSFLQRAYDQLIEDVCLQNLPVVFAVDRAGIVGADGETHHGLFDIAYLSSMPNMKILTPCNGNQLAAMIKYSRNAEGPVAIRYPRGGCDFDAEAQEVYDGKNIRLAEGKDIDIWAVGKMTKTAMKARTLLADKGIDAGVVDVTCCKPIDTSSFNAHIKTIYTLEDGYIKGGFGQNLAGLLPETDVITLGWPDLFIEHGTCEELFEKYGLDARSISERISEDFERKARSVTGAKRLLSIKRKG